MGIVFAANLGGEKTVKAAQKNAAVYSSAAPAAELTELLMVRRGAVKPVDLATFVD